MIRVIIKIGRKQVAIEDCKSISIKGASFRPAKRKDFRFKSYRPKIRDARQ